MQQTVVLFPAKNSHTIAFSRFLLSPCISLVIIPFRRRWRRSLSGRGFRRIDGRVGTCSGSLSGLSNGVVIRSWLLIIGSLKNRRSAVDRSLIRLLVNRRLTGLDLVDRLLARPGKGPVRRLAGRRVLRSLVDRPPIRPCERSVGRIATGLGRLLTRLNNRLTGRLPRDRLLIDRLPVDRSLVDRLLTGLLIDRLLVNRPLITRLLIHRLLATG